jgi:hypothetical protein
MPRDKRTPVPFYKGTTEAAAKVEARQSEDTQAQKTQPDDDESEDIEVLLDDDDDDDDEDCLELLHDEERKDLMEAGRVLAEMAIAACKASKR